MLRKSYIFLGIGILFLVAAFYFTIFPLIFIVILLVGISLYYGVKNITTNPENKNSINNLIPLILSGGVFMFILLFTMLLIIVILGIGSNVA